VKARVPCAAVSTISYRRTQNGHHTKAKSNPGTSGKRRPVCHLHSLAQNYLRARFRVLPLPTRFHRPKLPQIPSPPRPELFRLHPSLAPHCNCPSCPAVLALVQPKAIGFRHGQQHAKIAQEKRKQYRLCPLRNRFAKRNAPFLSRQEPGQICTANFVAKEWQDSPRGNRSADTTPAE
jgi:hypothetical protein